MPIEREIEKLHGKNLPTEKTQSLCRAYAMGQVGSARSGYWSTIDVVERRDLDQLRIKARRLIDGWKEFHRLEEK